ncbi:hypothetical protein N7533_013440 [Penicillium manginii]|jgi:hypothetical protein|uniref:uncharacterized protein n=1 Tax=Penicillium manginii TaxID=203109 RepID=UPI0025471B6B|nr:uncharacterized protein N7533_013440 [Penicillium manginii]KAJ5732993.1 hypothetical protein N7533_013440 [Penicillium manginii]
MTTTHETRVFAGVTLIDTPVVREALEFARAHHDPMSFHHVYRSWIFGALIASKIPAYESVDLEVHAVSAILHDLAWDYDSVFATKDKRFEVDSANAAREYLKREAPGFNQRQLQMVWDSIALHTTSSIAQHKEMEVALCHMGITADFLGSGLPGGLITKEEHSAVVKELPLLEFKDSVIKLLCALCKHKPETTYDNFVRDFGERFVDGYSRESKTFVDILMVPLD